MIYRTRRQWKSNCKIVGECWEWKHGYGGDGRPIISTEYGSNPEHASRLAYRLFKGKIKNHVCHTCDNVRCVRPKHLYDGTRTQNMKDSWARHPRNKQRRKEAAATLSKTWRTNKEFSRRKNKQMSERLKKLWATPAWRAKMRHIHANRSFKVRKEASERLKKLWANPKWCARQRDRIKAGKERKAA